MNTVVLKQQIKINFPTKIRKKRNTVKLKYSTCDP